MSQIEISKDSRIDISEPKTIFSPIGLIELKKLLEDNLLGVSFKKTLEEVRELIINNIYDFSIWYDSNKNIFSDAQKFALDTLMVFREQIDQGCTCKRNSRETRAHQYFEEFWTRNKDSDILPTIANSLNLNIVTVGNFCKYTR